MTPTIAPHLEPTATPAERASRRKTLKLLTLLDEGLPYAEQ